MQFRFFSWMFPLALLCFICTTKSYGQTTGNQYGKIQVEFTKEKKSKPVYAKVQITKDFTGGDSAWARSVEKSINQGMQINKRLKKGKYLVSVQFVMAKDGTIADIRPLTTIGFGMEASVVRALKKGPRWGPATSEGRPVGPYRTSSSTPPQN